MGRTFALIGSLAIICLLGYLTLRVAISEGIDILVILSLIVLALIGVGVVGALTSQPPDG
jgi:hypothetical protein